MPINDEQAKQIKEQLAKQIEKLPEDQKAQASEYISKMNNEELEQFLKQNQMTQQGEGQCIFCAIGEKKVPSTIIYEDKEHLAVFEIKPFTEGHVVLIPKKHIEKTKSLSDKSLAIANKIGIHLVEKLKAESFQITTNAEMGHAIINIIPLYKDQPLTYQRKESKPEDIEKLKTKTGTIKTEKPAPIKLTKDKAPIINTKEAKKAILKFSRRIP